MLVRSIMNKQVVVVTAETDLFDVAALMWQRRIRHLPVVDGDRRVVGMVSDRDLRRASGDLQAFLEGRGARDWARVARAGDIMTTTVATVSTETPLPNVVAQLVERQVGALPVLDSAGQLAGIVSYLDVIQALR
jgi:acetoin utilization protein AcuB